MMNKYQAIPSTQLEELIFNDEQAAKVGAALRALADEMTTTTTTTTTRKSKQSKEVIELLSDSDMEELIISESVVETNDRLLHRTNPEINSSKSIDNSFETRQRIKNKKRERSCNKDKDKSHSSTSRKYLSVAQFLEDDYDTASLSDSSEDSIMQYKFQYDQDQDSDEPTETRDGTQTTPTTSISQPQAYTTLTDITGEVMQVKELDLQQLMNGTTSPTAELDDVKNDEALTPPVKEEKPVLEQLCETLKTETPFKTLLSTPAQFEATTAIDNEKPEEESLLVPKQEIVAEEPHVQPPYCKEEEEMTVKPDFYSNEEEDNSFRNSFDDSNGPNTSAFGGDYFHSYDETDEDFIDHTREEQKLIDLVDSETDDEQETGYHNIANVVKAEFKPNTKSIDTLMSYTCPECCIECGTFIDWKVHTDAEHKFSTIDALNMKTIIDKDGHICYQCRDCEEKFQMHKTFHKLLSHRLKHLPNEEYIRCRLCNMRYRTKAQMRRHLIKSHHNVCREYMSPPKQKRPNEMALKYVRISCPICKEPQANRKLWQDHLEDMHSFTTKIMQHINHYLNDIYICTLCDVKMRKRSIMDHMLMHEKYKSFACTLCDNYKAIQIMLALSHVRRVHLMSEELQFKCNYCEATFSKKTARNKHLRMKHKVKWQECAVCHKEFFNISLLLSHMNFANHHKLK